MPTLTAQSDRAHAQKQGMSKVRTTKTPKAVDCAYLRAPPWLIQMIHTSPGTCPSHYYTVKREGATASFSVLSQKLQRPNGYNNNSLGSLAMPRGSYNNA